MNTVRHFCKTSDNRNLKRIRERARRVAFKAKTEPYRDLLIIAGLPNVESLGLGPSCIKEIFDSTPNSYNLRNNDFIIPRFNTAFIVSYSLQELAQR